MISVGSLQQVIKLTKCSDASDGNQTGDLKVMKVYGPYGLATT